MTADFMFRMSHLGVQVRAPMEITTMQHLQNFTAGVLCFLGVFAMPGAEGLSAVQVQINADGRQIKVSPDLYGIFYEEINHAGDGGLYAEMVQNRTFEENELSDHMRLSGGNVVTDNGWQYHWKRRTDLHGWSLVAGDGSDVAIALDDSHPLNAQSPHAMRVDIRKVGGEAGFANDGYWGMSVITGGEYLLSFYARSDRHVPITATLESADGTRTYAHEVVDEVGGDWRQYTCTLNAADSDPKARLVIRFDQPVTMWFDIVSLFPKHTYQNRIPGLRADLMGKLEELRPKFLRFPGGCVVEGCTLDNRIQWKQTIGDIAQRPGHWDLWGYRATDGLGFHEFLQLAEDLNAEAMYVCNVGMSCQARRAEVAENTDEIVNTYVQDTLDALEYATGSPDSQWGSLRARNGHPKPFKIKYVEIGNENGGPDYHRAYRLFYAAIKAKYPEIITIADQPIPDAPVEMVDEHFYVAPDWFFAHADRYDKYDRNGPKIYVGEYAVNNGVGSGNLLGALAEAAFMMGMERNSDIVKMASYAPLFENVNDREWPVNLIRFDSSRAIGRSSFYVQKLFSEHLPTTMVEANIAGLEDQEMRTAQGRIGLRTWLADAEFKDIRVTKGDAVLYASDFAKNADPWQPRRRSGNWVVENGVYRQTDPQATDTLTLVGDESWQDYTLELKAKRNGGAEAFIICFRNEGREHVQWNLGGWGNTQHAIQVVTGDSATIATQTPGSIEVGRWYDVKIVLHGHHVECSLDGQVIHSLEVKRSAPADFFANAGLDEQTGEAVVKLVNARADSRDVQLKLDGFGAIDHAARVITVCGDQPQDENSLDEPMKISPVESTIDNASQAFTYTVKPWSVTVLRLKTTGE